MAKSTVVDELDELDDDDDDDEECLFMVFELVDACPHRSFEAQGIGHI